MAAGLQVVPSHVDVAVRLETDGIQLLGVWVA